MAQPQQQVVAVHPFCYLVRPEEDGLITLMDIANRKVHVPLLDIRDLNEELKEKAANEPLTAGTTVLLPVVADKRGVGIGPYFTLRDEEVRLRACEARLNNLVAAHAAENMITPLPARRVFSKTEKILAAIHDEAERQLPDVEKKLASTASNRLPFLVDVDPIREAEKAVELQFSEHSLSLASFNSTKAHCFPALQRGIDETHLTPALMQTTVDAADDFCIEHTHRWEFMFYGAHSSRRAEVWAVLSCQTLTALIDAVECVNTLPLAPRKNAFMFVGGRFYVDDRHRDDPDYEDLTETIRFSDPLVAADREELPNTIGGSPTPLGVNIGFGDCQVFRAAATTFGDLHVKQGELCVLRHLGDCTHYFYLMGPRSLVGYPRTQRGQFPHRVLKRRTNALKCQLCHQFPSTIALYNDEISLTNPGVYCRACYELLHGGETQEAAKTYLTVFPVREGDYFKS